MVQRLLYLNPGELSRLLPFFGLYLLLFAGLTLADGLSLTLFIQQVGVQHLPLAYALIAVVNLILMGWYILSAEQVGSVRVFQLILGACSVAFFLAWAALRWLDGGPGWYAVFFVAREIAFTLILMHFGTYLQDYFTRDELNRVMSIVYAGGRVGGIAGGVLLERLSAPVGLLDLMGLFIGLGIASMVAVLLISRRSPTRNAPEDLRGNPGVKAAHAPEGQDPEEKARTSLGGFLRFVWASPLLFWTTVTTILFMACRWVLNYQYSKYLGSHFTDAAAMAEFLGRYTQIALLLSLILQLLVVNRLIAWIGLKGVHFVYGVLLFGGVLINLWPMTLSKAIYSRLVETELRFGLRNPVMQLITNLFSKAMRVRVRAWSLGLLIPLSTLGVSGVLSVLVRQQANQAIGWVGGLAGVGYVLASFGLYGSFRQRPLLVLGNQKEPRMNADKHR